MLTVLPSQYLDVSITYIVQLFHNVTVLAATCRLDILSSIFLNLVPQLLEVPSELVHGYSLVEVAFKLINWHCLQFSARHTTLHIHLVLHDANELGLKVALMRW